MDLRDAKKLIAWAQKRGIQALKVDGMEITFGAYSVTPIRRRAPKADPSTDERVIPPRDPGPTLEQLQDYIYQTDEDERH